MPGSQNVRGDSVGLAFLLHGVHMPVIEPQRELELARILIERAERERDSCRLRVAPARRIARDFWSGSSTLVTSTVVCTGGHRRRQREVREDRQEVTDAVAVLIVDRRHRGDRQVEPGDRRAG